MRLSDRIAIVTGGASGIGLASTRRLLEEGAAVVAFLASDDASVITGALIPIDGGYSAG